MRRGATTILDDVSFAVRPGERWLVLGANGSGKTSLLRIAALYEHPTSGTVDVLGERLGRTDVRVLRRRVGYASAALADQLRPTPARARRRAHGPLRRARAVVAHVHRRRRRAGPGVPRADGRRRVRRARARHAVVGRAPARAARPHADERPGRRAARRAVGAARPRRARAARRRPRRPRRRPGRPAERRRHPPRRRHPADVDARHAAAPGPGARAPGRSPTSSTPPRLSATFGLDLELERRPNGRFSAWARR